MDKNFEEFYINGFFNEVPQKYKKLFHEKQAAWDALDNIADFIGDYKKTINSKTKGVFLLNKNTIHIGNNCTIHPNVLIEGPVIIGDNCVIRFGAFIRAGSIIDDNCIVGNSSELVRSIVLSNSSLPHFNYVGDSIIGHGVNMGAGSKCANMRLDKNEVVVRFRGSTYNTKRLKFGAIIGDESSIGCNVVLNPGTILFKGSQISPGKVITGVSD